MFAMRKTRRDQSALQRSMNSDLQESDILRVRFARNVLFFLETASKV